MSACETHDISKLTAGSNGSAHNVCPTCMYRICFRCEKPSDISWMSGYCDACYRLNEIELRNQRAEYDRQEKQRHLAEAWEEGRKAGSQPVKAENPYLQATA